MPLRSTSLFGLFLAPSVSIAHMLEGNHHIHASFDASIGSFLHVTITFILSLLFALSKKRGLRILFLGLWLFAMAILASSVPVIISNIGLAMMFFAMLSMALENSSTIQKFATFFYCLRSRTYRLSQRKNLNS